MLSKIEGLLKELKGSKTEESCDCEDIKKKQNAYTLLIGMQVSRTTMEIGVQVLKILKSGIQPQYFWVYN